MKILKIISPCKPEVQDPDPAKLLAGYHPDIPVPDGSGENKVKLDKKFRFGKKKVIF